MTLLARLLSVRADLRDEAAAAEVTPDALAAYAERTGWMLTGTTDAHQVYCLGDGELQVPREAGWPDYGRRVLAELQELAAVEGRGTLAIWADLVGLGSRPDEKAPPCRETDRETDDQPSRHRSEAPDPSQGVLPGIDAGPIRRVTRHVFRGFGLREFSAGPLAPAATVTLPVRSCGHCLCLHRVASTGARLGAEDLYSTDGGTSWSTTSPPCIPKRPKEDR